MKAYSIDDNGYFVGEVICDQSPLEPGVFLIPRNALTETPPVFKEKERPKWDGKKWSLVRNWRGEKLFSKETKTEWLCDTFTPDLDTYTELEPPVENKNQKVIWKDSKWETLLDYSEITFFNKTTREIKKYEIGETPDLDTYTDSKPLENEPLQKWDESSTSWIIDEEAKNQFELLIRQSKIKQLLNESDYIELPSFLERKGQEIYNQWMNYRAQLRAAYHEPSLPLPEVPIG